MSEFEEYVAERTGVHLHRKMVLTAFPDVREGPLTDVLFRQTRPALRKQKTIQAKAATSSAPTAKIVRKGMVDYRRQLHHDF